MIHDMMVIRHHVNGRVDGDIGWLLGILRQTRFALYEPLYPSKYKAFIYHLHNAVPMSKRFGRRCTNVMQMLCVCCGIVSFIHDIFYFFQQALDASRKWLGDRLDGIGMHVNKLNIFKPKTVFFIFAVPKLNSLYSVEYITDTYDPKSPQKIQCFFRITLNVAQREIGKIINLNVHTKNDCLLK